MRRPIVGGNWKMNTRNESAAALARAVRDAAPRGVDVVLYPPFPYLRTVADALAGSDIALGAQDVYPEPDGAYTGEVSVGMLTDCGVVSVLVGHSERRHTLNEPDGLIARKVRAVLDAGLQCVLCIGETLDQRRAGRTDEVNRSQLESALAGIGPDALPRLVIAYEPVWAIGTGVNATPEQAQSAHAAIRALLRERCGPAGADVRIQYGGSVKPGNAPSLFACPDIDGGLIGGASLDAEAFVAIAQAAAHAPRS